MSSKSHQHLPVWIQKRILGFFNRARNVNMIIDGTIQDDPSDGPGKTIGLKLAARILRERNALPRRRFTKFAQLDNIRGVGQGTIDDLVFTFGNAADEVFKKSMYDSGTIFVDNWPLEYFRFAIEDKDAFMALNRGGRELRSFVMEKMKDVCSERNVKPDDRDAMMTELSEAYLDGYGNSSYEAAYAFALWFYKFDADNWFSWERIQEQTIPYFEHNMNTDDWAMNLYLFKGFSNRGIVPRGIAAQDLPVIVNSAEQSVTFWVSALYD